ncbi:hypothetical protein EMPS_04102 [Entomortierella parvispora]|uniref:Uncharacterized protein n=1 Tax=Entomortierella parvispora TaxID=205924 RepID=A0A9P3H7X4_9FUNG|nr:hypothetical protein EMPS_04102 [Entomortierella parvispora]
MAASIPAPQSALTCCAWNALLGEGVARTGPHPVPRFMERMYRKVLSPFVVQDLSEAYWGRKSWRLLMELLEDQDNIFMIDGEKVGFKTPEQWATMETRHEDAKEGDWAKG